MEVTNQSSEVVSDDNVASLDGQEEAITAKLDKSVRQEKNLRERLKAQESELSTLKEQMRLEAEKKMKEQNQYKELYEQEKKTLEQLKREKDMLIEQQLLAKRLNAFDQVAGRLKHNDFYKLLPIDKIVIDDNGEVVQDSVKMVMDEVMTRYGQDIFEKKQIGKLPSAGSSNIDLNKDYKNMSKTELQDGIKSALFGLHTNKKRS